jgi:hypothetical protein
MSNIGFKIINLDYIIGRCSITIQLFPSILNKLIIKKPLEIGWLLSVWTAMPKWDM